MVTGVGDVALDECEDHRTVRAWVRRYAEEQLGPIADATDVSGEFPRHVVSVMGDLGLLGLGFPEKYGGSGFDKTAFVIAVEEVYRVSAGIAASAFMSPLIAHDLLLVANETQCGRLVPGILSGALMAGLGVTEPDAGSDVAAITTRATRTDGGYVLNGQKRFITNGSIADVFLVLARTSPGAGSKGLTLFIVDRDTAGFEASRPLDKLGWRCSDTADLFFDDCYVADADVVGEIDDGFRAVMQGFNFERLVLAGGSIGLAQAALSASITYANERRQFGGPIGNLQLIRGLVADMASQVAAARALTYAASRRLDGGLPCAAQASMAKLIASEMCQRVTRDAIQVHGGVGFTMELPVQRYHRDSIIMTIGGGTSQVQQEIIARELGLTHRVEKGA